MDSITYTNIIEYNTSLELNFHHARNTDRVLCSCGKWILKGGKWGHWKSLKQIRDVEHILLQKKK